MKTLISQCPICSPRPHFLFNFPSLSRENRKLLGVHRGKWTHGPRFSFFAKAVCASSTSESASYGGWDDSGLDSDRSGEEFRNFLSSIGIGDRKQVFVFLLGVLCALAISRVRVSSIVVFPASVLVFAVGFSFGIVRGGGLGELSSGGNRKRSKEETFRVYMEKFRNLAEIVDDFDANVDNLRRKIQKAIDSRGVTVSELEDCTKVLECIGVSAANARSVIDVSSSTENPGSSGVVLIENQKPNKRKKNPGEIVGFDFSQSIGGLFRKNVTDPKPVKVKNLVKQETVVEGTADNLDSILCDEEMPLNPVSFEQPEENINVISRDSVDELSFDDNGRGKRFSDVKEYTDQRNRTNNNQTARDNRTQTRKYRDNVLESVNFSIRTERTETEASFVREQKVEKSDDIYRSSSQLREETTVNVENNMVSDDAAFARYLTEANDLLIKAKEYIRNGNEKEQAEIGLYRCAKLLLKAMAMEPENLLAVGLLGNTYLLHGELKLRISRELRTTLIHRNNNNPSSVRKWGTDTERDRIGGGKDDIASALIEVCEECEELLVEAGRKYRLALSIDENDVRALYNWGLALTFRAQLISDIGPEASSDADKVFLAAIDKFDAMLSKGSVYAPDALFRWGMVLQQRSRLRPSNSKEKAKLLHQAKRLFEDALDMNSNIPQLRHALSSCVSELSSTSTSNRRLYKTEEW